MEKYTDLTQERTISFEPWNFDGQGLALAPGQRCRVTIECQGKPPITFDFDRYLAGKVIDFLDKEQK